MARKANRSALALAKAYVRVLREHDEIFESAWLFGSAARNQMDEDSDIDIAVVMKDVPVKLFKEVELMKYRRQVDSRIEPHVLTTDEFDSPFFLDVARTGVRIA